MTLSINLQIFVCFLAMKFTPILAVNENCEGCW